MKMESHNLIVFLERIRDAVAEASLVKLILSHRRTAGADLQRVMITLARIKKEIRMNFVYRYPTRDITKNFSEEEGMEQVRQLLAETFYNADLITTAHTDRLLITPQGKVKLRTGAGVSEAPSLRHDREKNRLIEKENSLWMKEAGILNAESEIRPGMHDKYLQINRYLEILAPVIGEMSLPERFTVADMGSGKGYLTFALYDYLSRQPGMKPAMTGVETRKELVDLSNRIARTAGFGELTFVRGTIREAAVERPDILIALHACDTATDDAIYRGITAGSSLIVCAPCCHKQVRKAFHVTGAMEAVTRHGILEERQAEIITDAIRALVLEEHGYSTRVFEFIATEHTPKNVMIAGRKTKTPKFSPERCREQIRALKEPFGIGEHYLEGLFRDA